MMVIKSLTILLAVALLALVLELVRKEKLTFKYAAGWLFVSVLAILLTLFDHVLFRVADAFGFELTSNFIFFSLLSVFVFLSFFMTVFLCQQNRHIDTIAQKLGILEHTVEKLKGKK